MAPVKKSYHYIEMNIIRYGVETASFESMFKLMHSVNRHVGLNIKNSKPSVLEILKAGLFNFPATLTYAFLLVSAVFRSDQATIGSCLLVISGGMVNIFPKFLTLLFSSQNILNLMTIVESETNEESMRESDEKQRSLLRKYVTVAKVTTNIEFFSFCFCFLLLYVLPYFVSVATSQWISPLGVQIVGVSAHSHPGYELHMLLTQYMVAYTMTLMGTSDILFFYFTLYIAFQFDNCKYLVSSLGTERDNTSDSSKRLRRAATVHSNISKFCKMCSKTFQWVIFFEISSVSLCLVVSLTMHQINPWLYTMAIQVITLQLLIFCLFAELVNTKSQETSTAIYSCNWYNLRCIPDRKLFLMLLHNSQSSMSFSPLGIIVLSLETFVKVIRAAFSYYTFLNSVL